MRVVHFVPETWYFHPRISKRENYTNFMLRFCTSDIQKPLDLVHWNYVILRPNNIDLSRDRGWEEGGGGGETPI